MHRFDETYLLDLSISKMNDIYYFDLLYIYILD